MIGSSSRFLACYFSSVLQARATLMKKIFTDKTRLRLVTMLTIRCLTVSATAVRLEELLIATAKYYAGGLAYVMTRYKTAWVVPALV